MTVIFILYDCKVISNLTNLNKFSKANIKFTVGREVKKNERKTWPYFIDEKNFFELRTREFILILILISGPEFMLQHIR